MRLKIRERLSGDIIGSLWMLVYVRAMSPAPGAFGGPAFGFWVEAGKRFCDGGPGICSNFNRHFPSMELTSVYG